MLALCVTATGCTSDNDTGPSLPLPSTPYTYEPPPPLTTPPSSATPATQPAPTPKPKPTPTRTATPTKKPSPIRIEPSPLPPTGKGFTKQTAQQFAVYFVRLAYYGQITGDIRALRSVSASTCENCRNVMNAISDVYRKGGRVREIATGPRVVRLTSASITPVPRALIKLTTAEGTYLTFLPNSPPATTGVAGSTNWELALGAINGKWICLEFVAKGRPA